MSERPQEPQTSLEFPEEKEIPKVETGVLLEFDEHQIAWVVFDLPGEKVNKLTTPVMEAIRDCVDAALRRQARGLVFVSDKPDMFIAGAAIEEISGVTDAALGREKAAYGQAVFESIARFPRTTIAVVTGPCVGGGYELALACDAIVVENKPSVRVGLPEVKLGILPGFGGTQRLPRRVGLPQALDMILGGKTLPAKPAYRRRFCDALVPPGEGRRVAREVIREDRVLPTRPLPLQERLMARVPPVRNLALNKARGMLRKRAPGHQYPSPYMALDAVAAGFSKGEVQAYGEEARLLGEAITTPTSKNLVWLYLAQGESKNPVGLDLSLAYKPKRLAVLGAGIMGGGIAWLAAEKGFPIRIKDIDAKALEGAVQTAGSLWSKAVKRRKLTVSERDRRLERLSYTLDFTGFNHLDLVMEAVVENLEVKQQVIHDTEARVNSTCVIASNTSSIPIGEIAQGAQHPERVVGLHFFNPVNRMPLVEVIAGDQSADWAVATAYQFALDLGKTPIMVRDKPAFLVNRLLAIYLAEALALLEAGADQRIVDAALKDFGMPMGPYALLDQIGLDVAAKVTASVRGAFGDRMPESSVVEKLVSQNFLGKKTRRGFYEYDPQGVQGNPSPPARAAAGSSSGLTLPDAEICDRLLLPMVNEAARCLEEGLVARPLDVDLGMVMGTGFPPFRGGLLRWADQRGVSALVGRLQDLAQAAAHLAPSEALRRRERGFYAAG